MFNPRSDSALWPPAEALDGAPEAAGHGHGDRLGGGRGGADGSCAPRRCRASNRPGSARFVRDAVPRIPNGFRGEQDPLTQLLAQTMGNHAMAAFVAVGAVPITCELPSPAMQGGEPQAQQSTHHSGPCAGRHGGIYELQGLAAILRRGQSTSSSPQ